MLEQEEITAEMPRPNIMRIILPPMLVLISVLCGGVAALAAWYTAKADTAGTVSHYFADTPARLALYMLLPISVILSFTLPLTARGELPRNKSLVSSIFSWLTAIGLIAVSVYILLKGLGVSWDIGFALIALIAAAFYAVKPLKGSETAKILLSFASTAFGIALIALLYFDFEIELNSHYKLATQFAGVGLLLGTLADARGVMSRIKLRWSMILRSISLTLTLTCFGSVVTAFMCGNTALPTYYLVFALFFLAYSLMSACELISFSFADK